MDPRPPVIRLAVFGTPIAQSLSPRIHGLFARQLDLRVDYRTIEATPDSFLDQLRKLHASGARGCNVTAPLKRIAWESAARCSESATRAQAANTLVFDGEILADNTDGRGLVSDLSRLPGCCIGGGRICLLGAGGAAAGVLAALLKAQPQCIVIANRTVDRAEALAERHADLGKVQACRPTDVGDYAPFDLLINATSHGHVGEAPPLQASWLVHGGLCYDLNYGRAATPLREACESNGIRYADGLGMLVSQAALSFALWTDRLPDVGPVLTALRRQL